MPTSTDGGRVPGPAPSTRYLVEISGMPGGVHALADRARRAGAEVTRAGAQVRLLRVVFVPEDDSCFLLYDAESERALGRAVRRAGIAVRRIAPSFHAADLPDDDSGDVVVAD